MRKLVFLLAVIPAVAIAGKSFNEGKGATWDCAKDADVSINTSKSTYTFKGECSAIAVNGNDVKVIADTAKEITVNGNNNTVTVGTLGEVTVNGNKNAVVWKKSSAGDKPGVQNNGNDNSVAQEKAPAKPPAKK